jgi:hypothetical protein
MKSKKKERKIRTYFLILVGALLFFSYNGYAQDTIYTKDGREIAVKIINNDGSSIKYVDSKNPNAAIRSFNITYIDFIKYENGTIERFVETQNKSIISPQIESDPTKTFLQKKYERNLSVENFGKATWTSGLVGMGVFLLVGFITNFEGDLTYYGFTGSGILVLAGLPIDWVGSTKASHYKKRLDSLSLILVPSHDKFAMNHSDNYMPNIGIRITF